MKPSLTNFLPRPSELRWGSNWNTITALILTVGLFALALPDRVDAKPGYEVHPGGVAIGLYVGKRAGYEITVSANDRQRVRLRFDRSSSVVEYSTKGYVSSRRIKADFGALGRIDVRLHFGRYPPNSACKGRPTIYRDGTYRGTIKSPQDESLPEISVQRGHVYFKRSFRRVCKKPPPPTVIGPKRKPKLEVSALMVGGKGEGRTALLEVLNFALKRNPARSGGLLGATVYERHEGVRITRRTNIVFDHDSFVMSKRGKAPETVEVKLPKPFSGHALYSRSLTSPSSWAGDLSVDLPGARGVHLTGPDFRAVLCRRSSEARLLRCLTRQPLPFQHAR